MLFMLLIRDSLCTYYKNNIIHGENRTPFKTVNKETFIQQCPMPRQIYSFSSSSLAPLAAGPAFFSP